MTDRWRRPTARDLVKAIRAAGGSAERIGRGQIRVVGPTGTVTIHEPATETRRDLRRSAAYRLIEEKTGLALGQ